VVFRGESVMETGTHCLDWRVGGQKEKGEKSQNCWMELYRVRARKKGKMQLSAQGREGKLNQEEPEPRKRRFGKKKKRDQTSKRTLTEDRQKGKRTVLKWVTLRRT